MKNKIKLIYLLPLITILLVALSFILDQINVKSSTPSAASFEAVLHSKEKRLTEEMQLLAKQADTKSYDRLFSEKPEYYNQLMEKEGIALMIYENDTLKFWSDNSIAIENWIKEVCLDTKMVKLRNGWFEVMKPQTNSTTTKAVIGLLLIKNEYPYQNKYLVNEFQKDFDLHSDTKLITDKPNDKNSIRSMSGDYLFSLENITSQPNNSFLSFLVVLINLIIFICVLLFLQKLFFLRQEASNRNIKIILFVASIVLLRYLSIIFSYPDIFYTFDLFNPKVFGDASSIWLTSLGDLLINIILFFYLSYFLLREFDFKKLFSSPKNVYKIILSFIFFLAFLWFSWIITEFFTHLIKNSNIVFSINNLFAFNIYSYLGIVIIGLLLFSYFLYADKLVDVLKQLNLSNRQYVFIFLISSGIHSLISFWFGTLDSIVIILPLIIILSIVIIKAKQKTYSFAGIVFLVFVFSIYAVDIFTKHTRIKEKETRKIFAEKLAIEEDPIAELLFQDIENKIQTDSVLISYVNKTEKKPAEFEKRIKQMYFSGYWEKYDVRVALFDSMCGPVIKSHNSQFDNNFYFDELIAKKGMPTTCEHFNFIKSESGKITYLAKLAFYKNARTLTKFGFLYIELNSKFISDEIGFPQLLLDRNIGLSEELTNYSYAKYKHGILINHYGKYAYGLSSDYFNASKAEFTFLDKEDFNHLLFRPDAETLIVLSIGNEGFLGLVTTFSYLFAFFSILLLLIIFLKQVSERKLKENFSFKNRIQALLITIVLLTLGLFGGGTIYYIDQKFETQNENNISEKVHSVLIDLESKLSTEDNLHKNLAEYVSYLLKKSSSVFFTDINLYDAKGNLYASSRSQVFDEGLTSKKINQEAYLQIAVRGKTDFVHNERIGKLNYLSAYIPLNNKDGQLLAYLNLPYFAKQGELEKEISGFLVALINIYVLLFALSILIAIFISNYITKPLKIIQDKLSKIKLGKTNERIEWKGKDEIGNLVSEYNRMISELSMSADLLARSERESAWREMAKQVAHEIKNPLTPIKLSIQHLQRAWKDNAPDMDEKIDRLSKTIIEQINSLSSIASEFSNFAKMPRATLVQVDVKEILINCINLFHHTDTINIRFNCTEQGECFIYADKEQLLRMFNNLLKNAVQAIPEKRKGHINVSLKRSDNDFIISIEDNGTGINTDAQHKIFSPNFTTKTGGMGLGLAIVKNIIEGINGKIWFTTESDKGTTFYISFPSSSAMAEG